MTRITLRSCRQTSGPLFVSLCKTLSNKAYPEKQQQIQRAGNERSHCVAAGRTCAQLVLSSPVESKTRGYHGGFRSAQRTVWRQGRAGPDRTARRFFRWPRSQQSVQLSRTQLTIVLNVLVQARTEKTYFKPMEDQNLPFSSD